MATLKCAICGQEFEVKASAVANFKYCSDKCRAEAHKTYYYNYNKPGPGLAKVDRRDINQRKPVTSNLAKTEAEARALGMTYGKYKAQQYLAAQKEREQRASEKKND